MKAIPQEKGRTRARKRKIPYVSEICTGCGGKPICREYCKNNAIVLIDDTENYPFKRAEINKDLCIGCRACISKGKDGIMLTGCPWNAIRMN